MANGEQVTAESRWSIFIVSYLAGICTGGILTALAFVIGVLVASNNYEPPQHIEENKIEYRSA